MRKIIALTGLIALAATSQATILTFVATLSGAQETPPNASPFTGDGKVVIDTVALTFTGYIRWTGLSATPTGSHIHVGVAGTAGDVIYNYGVAGLVTDGIYTRKNFSGTLINKTQANSGGTGYNGILQTPAQQIADWFSPGHTYINVHNASFPGGELRGQLLPVPEPAPVAVIALGALGLLRRRKAR